jgi:c-di-GMP-binding flagellar brake protein YcgR
MVKEKEIPLKIEVFSNNEDSEFLIHSQHEIRSILRTIFERNTRAALYYNEGNSFVLTMLLGITEEGIWIDPPSNPSDSRNILNSNRIIFVSTHNQAKVQFVADGANPVIFNGRNAVFLSLPPKLLRLQRREYYRLTAWPENPLTCVFKPVHDHHHIKHDVTIMDISIGGIALVCQETSLVLTPGNIYPNCEIVLPDTGTLTATIQVKNTFDVTARTGEKIHRAGCVFVKPDGTTTSLLQRYVANMQRQAAAAAVAAVTNIIKE